MVQKERIKALNQEEPVQGRYVLYWMQQSQRAEFNHALEYAVQRANELDVPALAVFGITQRFPDASLRHYRFMLEGLAETADSLAERGVRLLVLMQPPVEAALALATDACLLVTDRGYLDIQRQWRRRVADRAGCPVLQVESDVVVPVETASGKEEYAARTIRPKIHEHLPEFLRPVETVELVRDSLDLGPEGECLEDIDALLGKMRINRDVAPSAEFSGGRSRAEERLRTFLSEKLDGYDAGSNDPVADCVSHMSPYLHFGQISPVEIALRVQDTGAPQDDREAYLEQLIVRRELSMNFCYYSDCYDGMDCLPDWARETLREEADTRRKYVYSRAEFDRADTHDPYWNAAQHEMVLRGKMHNYMRMYWGKKILEWTESPEEAWEIALDLNNRYELDGRDPNGYTGVAWCFGKHDRGWAPHPVYGKVRYMSAGGLERKFDMDAYIDRVDALEEA
jgi:deoxyribodipyrimidine photo-lyase